MISVSSYEDTNKPAENLQSCSSDCFLYICFQRAYEKLIFVLHGYVNKVINFGTIELDKVGINHLTLKATNTKKHKPVGIWKLQLVSANTKVE